MSRFSKYEVDKIQDTLTSIVDSFIHNGYSPESVAEAFIREGHCLEEVIDDMESKRSKRRGRDNGYSSSSSSPGHDSGYSSSHSSQTGSRGYRAHEYRPGGGSRDYPKYADGAYNSGSRGYRTHEYRPGGYADSSYTASTPSGTKPDIDLYKLLGISKTAAAEEIKSAHRKLCMKYHPDRVTSGPSSKKAATELMAQINQANDVLKDSKLRAYYDRTGLISPKL